MKGCSTPAGNTQKAFAGKKYMRLEDRNKIIFKPDQLSGLDSDFFCESFEGRGELE